MKALFEATIDEIAVYQVEADGTRPTELTVKLHGVPPPAPSTNTSE
jgi:hypothetical protein